MTDETHKRISYQPTDGLSYDPIDPKYWDEAALNKELNRAFELCHGCRMCFKYCDSFPKLFEFIDKNKFEPVLIGISSQGVWYLTPSVTKEIESGEELSLRLNPKAPTFLTLSGKTISVDIIFPVLHGTDGEDGSIQGLIKAMDIPMIGTGVLGSAMSMSKLVTKRLLKEAGLPVADFLYAYYEEKDSLQFEIICEKLGLPFMVKSASLGSSVGV